MSHQNVGRTAARDYIYKRLDELKEIILSRSGSEREEAKKERAFLEGQLKIVYGKGGRNVKLDPTLARLVRDGTSRAVRSSPMGTSSTQPKKVFVETPYAGPKKAPTEPIEQSSYWDKCKEMDFGQLRQFIDDSLLQLSMPNVYDRPCSKAEFLTLQEMLYEKASSSNLPEMSPVSIKPAKMPRFVPSKQLKSLFDQRSQVARLLIKAKGDTILTFPGDIKKIKYRLQSLEQNITSLEKSERQEYERRREHERSIQQRDAGLRRRQPLNRRLQIVERVRRDIERAFEFGAIVPTSRLPWRVLPSGELSVNNVLEYYGRLQRLNPHIRYERDRITKAFKLHPDQCYIGRDDFDGYIVLTFAHTPRALLECPVYGNAIYIIDSDWKRLSRTTKQELLARPEVTKIVHKGDWFWRVKHQLGIR